MAAAPLAELHALLAQAGGDFLCDTDLPAPLAKVRFSGSFQGAEVAWEMTLTTLHYQRHTLNDPSAARCPFIEIKPDSGGVYPITVALDLPAIDEPVIRKSIIMVRNYKRLIVGKIEFCPPAT